MRKRSKSINFSLPNIQEHLSQKMNLVAFKPRFFKFLMWVFVGVAPLVSTAQTLSGEWVKVNAQGCKVLDPYSSPDAKLTWDGPCLNGLAIGKGTLKKYIKGKFESKFEGKMNYGVREGLGKFTHKDGSVKEGSFVNAQLVGYGTMKTDIGEVYEGNFINYRMHGNGKLTLPNGSVSEGFFVSDKLYAGKYTTSQGKTYNVYNYVIVENLNSAKRTNYYPVIGKEIREYFDEKWNRCEQKKAVYYRMVNYMAHNKPKGIVKDFYMNGALQSEFTAEYLDYDDENKNFHEGEATWYHENGVIEQKRYYYNNELNGKNSFYYDNGELEIEATYDDGALNGPYRKFYKSGKIKLFAIYESDQLIGGKFIEFDENGAGAFVHNENFYSNKEDWQIEEVDNFSQINQDNELKVYLKKASSTASRSNHIAISQNRNYSIESIIQKNTGKSGEGYGLIFGQKDTDNYNEFTISEFGSFAIFSTFEGVTFNIKDWTKSSAINLGNQRNRLKILKFADKLLFSINGQVVATVDPLTFRGNNIGLMARGQGEFTLENITVKEFVTEEELEKIFAGSDADAPSEWTGGGTGFFLSEEGYIATNYHVIEDASEIVVEYFQNGKKRVHPAIVVVSDKQNDLSILKIKDSKFRKLNLIPYVFTSSTKDVGTSVFTLGYPLTDLMGDEIKFTDGKINSRTGFAGNITQYQISVPIQPGNSGGPLFDDSGNLVGITAARLNARETESQNVNYAIKSSYLKNLIDALPEKITLPNYTNIANRSLTDKIKILSNYIPVNRTR